MFSNFVVLTQSSTFLIGPIAQFFGIIMNAIFNFFYNTLGIQTLGVSIILFTVIIRMLMLPLAIKQQKSMMKMQELQPQLKKIQDKYKNKKDQESQRKMQMELSKLYQENNASPFGGCLPLLVQFPIIIALFDVLRKIPAYIGTIKEFYLDIVANISTIGRDKLGEILTPFLEGKRVSGFDVANDNSIIDLLSQFKTSEWTEIVDIFNGYGVQIKDSMDKIMSINYFAGINLADPPNLMSIGVLIPILNIVVQFLVSKTTMAKNASGNDQQATTNKTMMYTMPLITAFFVVSMPAGLGLYWLTSSSFQLVQQIVINRHLKK